MPQTHLNTPFTQTPKASHSKRTYTTPMPVLVEKGRHWLCMWLLETLGAAFSVCLAYFSRGWKLLAQRGVAIFWMVVHMILSGCILLWQHQVGSLVYVMVAVNMGFTLPALVNTVLSLIWACKGREVSEEWRVFFTFTTLFHYSFAVLTVTYMVDVSIGLAISMLLILYFTGIVYNSLVILGIVLVPVMMIIVFVEGIVRFISCQTDCPSLEKQQITYEYQPYWYQPGVFGATQCIICLENYNENAVVVVLGCHRSHMFHEQCLLQWFNKNIFCPICRASVSFAGP